LSTRTNCAKNANEVSLSSSRSTPARSRSASAPLMTPE
jgi:hypothetical protein